jgi:DNA-binding transcriptional LysR family regulator
MEFQQLEMFVAVVEEGSISRASERVCRTGPAVSIALRKLEDEIGVSLFDRSDRTHYLLTPGGELLYSSAIRILDLRKTAMTSVRDLVLGREKTLRLGTHESVSLYVLPSLLLHFQEAHSAVNTEILCGSVERILTALRNDTIELALIAEPPNDPKLERDPIIRDELVLITNPEHRLASAGSVSVHDLANEFLLVQGAKSKLRGRIVQALTETDTPFTLRAENVAIEAIKRMVADGLGIGFVPLMCVREETARGELATVKIQDVPSEWTLWLVRRKDQALSSGARSFIELSLGMLPYERFDPTPDAMGKNHSLPAKRMKSLNSRPGKVVHC